MKRFLFGQFRVALFFSFLFLAGFFSFAQIENYKSMMHDNTYNLYEVVEQAEAYFKKNGRGKGSGAKIFERWRAENESKFYPSGDRHNVDHYLPQKAYQAFITKQNIQKNKTSFPNGWVELGPWDANNVTSHYSPGIGRVETFWINPNDDQHMYLGSRSGGFWRTKNGGKTWENTTDFLVASGVPALAVNPNNSDEILISVEHGGMTYTHGIYRSTDGGTSWVKSNFNPTNLGWGGLGDNEHIYKIAYHPSVANQVFICSTKGLFVSNDNLNTWFSPFNSKTTDVSFHPSKNGTIYAYRHTSNDANRILISTNGGSNFFTGGTFADNNQARIYLSSSAAAPNHIYAASNNNVYRSNDEGVTFEALSNPNSNGLAFAVSDLNTDNMIYGYVDLFASTNGGTTFTQKTQWANQNDAYIHADLRIAQCINGVFYVGTDGYLAKSSDNGNTWTRLNDGTAIRENYAVGLSQGNYDINMAGSQDNGTSILNKNGWIEWNGGDGMEALVHPLNQNWMIGSWQFGTRNYTQNGGLTRNSCQNPEGGSSQSYWEAPLLQNPQNSMQVYHMSDTIYSGNNFGTKWTFKSNPEIGIIQEAAIAETDSNVIAVARNNNLRLTTDGGQTWKNINTGLNYYVRDIAFDPKDENTIIVVYNRYQNDNRKVYLSIDQGDTWENITHNLGSMPLRTVVIDHSDSSYIYVGGEIGVYYKSMNANQWQLYNNNLPNVTVKDLEIHYGSNTLRAATWGRGLWEYTLVGRNNYPSITHTSISNTPTLNLPKDGVDQYVTSTINFAGRLSEVKVLWSKDHKNLDSTISMKNVGGNTWETIRPISSNKEDERIFFKVIALSEVGEKSETYTFDYLIRPFEYCIPSTAGTGSDYINYVKLEEIENYSNQDAYGDFTAQSTTLELNKEYTLEVGMNYAFPQDSVTAWIDYNRDGEFSIEEQITFNELEVGGNKITTGKFSIPSDALINKDLRLRVRSQYFTNPMSPCQNSPGEVEDYTVRLKKPEINSILTNDLANVNISPNPTSGKFSVYLDKVRKAHFSIQDMSGRILYQETKTTQQLEMNPNLSSGTYLVHVTTKAGVIIDKLIVK